MQAARPDIQLKRAGIQALLVLAGCGGGGATNPSPPPPPPPPPAPVVTTVEVSQAAATLNVGETLPLTATVKDQTGAVMAGKTVAWSSSALGVATVSTSGLVTAVAAGSATISATVDAKAGVAQITVSPPAPLVLDPAKAVNDSIGPSGGALQTTAANGVNYRLTIPPNALLSPRRITMTPVQAMGQLPVTGGLLGAVDFQPSGLRFAIPAALKITVPTAPPNGLKLVGFSYSGQAQSIVPAAAADSGSSVTLPVSHFSGTGAAFGTPIQVETFLTTSQSNNSSSQFYINSLIGLAGLSPRDFNAEMQVMRDWSANVIIPAITNAQNDFGLVLAESEYAFWLQFPLIFGLTGASAALAPERAAVGAAAAPKLRAAIAGNNAECVANRDLSSASNALFWQTQAAVFGVDTPAEQLDRRTVLAGLCIQVVLTVVNYPNPALAGQQGTLDVRAGLKFGSDPNLDLQPFSWSVDVHGSTRDGQQQGLADALGKFSVQITPTGQAPLNMLVSECLMNNAVPYLDVCGNALVLRIFGRTIVADVFVNSDVGLSQISDVAKIDGRLIISNVTSTDLHELALLTEVTGAISVSNAPNLNSLSGLASLTKIGGLNLVNLPKMQRPTLVPAVTDVGTLSLINSPIDDLGGLSGLTRIGFLGLDGIPIASLGQLQHAHVEGLHVARLINLPSLTGPQYASVVGQLFLNDGNTALADVSALSVVTDVTEDFALLNPVFGSVAPFHNLKTVRSIRIDPGTALANYDFPALAFIGNGGILVGSRSPCGSFSSVAISFPALVFSHGGFFGTVTTGSSWCPIDVTMTGATLETGVTVLQGGIRSLNFKALVRSPLALITTERFRIQGASMLQSITLSQPIDIRGDFSIIGNPVLNAVNGISGRVGGQLVVQNNPALSTPAINAWPLIVIGMETVFGNGP